MWGAADPRISGEPAPRLRGQQQRVPSPDPGLGKCFRGLEEGRGRGTGALGLHPGTEGRNMTWGNCLVSQWLGLGTFTARAQVQSCVGD